MLFWTMLKHVVLCRHHSKGVPSHRHGAFLPPLGLQTYIDISISTIGGMTYPHLQAVTLACHGPWLAPRSSLRCCPCLDGDLAEPAGTYGEVKHPEKNHLELQCIGPNGWRTIGKP